MTSPTTVPSGPEYTAGEWVAVVAPGRVALLPPGTPPATVQRLWVSLRTVDGPCLADHLQVLVGGDLSDMPPFAVLTVVGARLHAVVRGTVEVHVTVAGRSRVLTAPHVSTWSEEVVEAVDLAEVRAPGHGAGGEVLPVVCGVVRAGGVRVPVGTQAGPAGEAPGTDLRAPDRRATDVPGGDLPDLPAGVDTLDPAPDPDPWPALDPWPVPWPGLVLAGAAGTATPAVAAACPPSPAPRPPTRPAEACVPSQRPAVADPRPGGEPVDITLLRPAPADDAAPADPAELGADASTDHDGTTVLGHEVLALRRQLPEWTGHGVVGAMGAPAPAAPTPARIALSTGEVVSLSRPVLLGRAPQASRLPSSQVPRLVTLPSPLQDISRTHAEVRMDGDDVVVTDLRSTNGVLVVHPAGAPQRLQPGEATVLQPGVLVDLGEGVTFTVERGA